MTSFGGTPQLAHSAQGSMALQLPPEILAHIFDYVAQASTDKDPNSGFGHWVKEVTHVCRVWRAVALATPHLWSDANLHPHDWALEVLRRAQNTPIDLKFCDLDIDDPHKRPSELELIKAAFAHPEWIRSIIMRISCVKADEVMVLTSSLLGTSEAPLLRELTVISWGRCTIPDELLGIPGGDPSLRHLDTSNCFVNLSTRRFHKLRSLRLAGFTGLGISLLSLCTALREMHDLETLKLETPIAVSVVPDEVFELPGLHTLLIKSDTPHLGGLFSLLKVVRAPSILKLTYDSCEVDALDAMRTIYSFLPPRFFAADASATPSLTIWGGVGSHRSDVLGLEQCSAENSKRTLHVPHIDLGIDRLWGIIPHENLGSLTFKLGDDPLQAFYGGVVVSSLLQSLSLQDLHVPYRTFGYIQHDPSTPAFPSLRKLTLDCYWEDPDFNSLLRIRDWLVSRRVKGFVDLDRLMITDCASPGAAIMEDLKNLVGSFFMLGLPQLGLPRKR